MEVFCVWVFLGWNETCDTRLFLAGKREECFLLIVSIDNHSLWRGTAEKKNIIQHLL